MKVSTRGRYALRLMLDLALNNTGEPVRLKDVAKRQEISEKYLEAILKVLVRERFLIGMRGKGGGYKLTKEPKDYSLGEILRLTEATLRLSHALQNSRTLQSYGIVSLTSYLATA